MVMDTPSPQNVGEEFVRQYYTMLHDMPQLLHRFYSSSSTFVHGGVDRQATAAGGSAAVEEPVIGQSEIDKKIRTLNFKNCHTKIRQVDSQATIGNGVVVQVSGELSNNGEPMRRFMQTFVLAPQSPTKFYVHNDIFRYQDEVYQDSDTESEDHQPPPPAASSTSTTAANTATIETLALAEKVNALNNNNYYSQAMAAAAAAAQEHEHAEIAEAAAAAQQQPLGKESMLNGHAGETAVYEEQHQTSIHW